MPATPRQIKPITNFFFAAMPHRRQNDKDVGKKYPGIQKSQYPDPHNGFAGSHSGSAHSVYNGGSDHLHADRRRKHGDFTHSHLRRDFSGYGNGFTAYRYAFGQILRNRFHGFCQESAPRYVLPYPAVFFCKHRQILHVLAHHPYDHRRDQRADGVYDDNKDSDPHPLDAGLLPGDDLRGERVYSDNLPYSGAPDGRCAHADSFQGKAHIHQGVQKIRRDERKRAGKRARRPRCESVRKKFSLSTAP